MAHRPAVTPSSALIVTAIAPPIVGADDLADAFLQDTLDKASHPCVGARVTVASVGNPADAAQIGNAPGARLVQMTGERIREGADRVALIGSNVPHLPAAYLAEAFGRLGRGDAAADVVLGPSERGGCYLVALRAGVPDPGLFWDLPWTDESILEVTRGRARALGLRVAHLPRWYEIGTAADLVRLRRDLNRGVVDAPHTASALRSMVAR